MEQDINIQRGRRGESMAKRRISAVGVARNYWHLWFTSKMSRRSVQDITPAFFRLRKT